MAAGVADASGVLTMVAGVYSHAGPIRRRKRGYILMTDQWLQGRLMHLEAFIIPASMVSSKYGEEDRFLGERISRLEAFVKGEYSLSPSVIGARYGDILSLLL
eukprot:4570086-Pyramimonas_sp.AAC.3